ncbi:alkyl sulfatase dimerization domain-containing protein [Rivibacter subsaxonicus]|uniref:Alkyl sulfatase BDS1-like metallo-beta-lactamase superfamily hydrolase n=1 Tax=Rivibacter subsaxonicus TaxID=457575 RepID=A0A4Q7VNM8_9BURK|nr:alkyl sulfatase dimerization domain-containing protein [Rivibacter subsaxonicus]RZT97981.1 alkyl sulfatase BDS1-like metallo-beta-lactamase superfamily hydrolase [Rivibacter subsaxonicus]
MSRFSVAFAVLTTPALLLASAGLVAAEPPPRPDKYFVPFSAPQNFIDHARYFKEEAIKVGPYKIWSINTPNGGIGNVIVIEGTDGVVLIDSSVGVEHATRARELMRGLTSKPVVALIYTHHHADHTNGTAAFVSREDAQSGKVKIIAAENFMRENERENGASGPIMALRAGYMYGVLLPPDAEGTHYHIGCCGFTVTGAPGFIAPNTLVPLDKPTEMTLAGLKFVFFHTGGEAASHIGIYLPQQRIVFAGDEIQGPTFPQLHSLRGTRPRDIERWFGAIDRMRAYKADYLVPGHGQIVAGADKVETMLTNYRDAMQYVLDQSVRLINMGLTPDELAETVALPKAVQVEPWGIEYYGNVHVSTRNVYGGYISWWNGDPAELGPTPRLEKARRTVAMMGGRDKVFAEAERAFFAGDAQWAAELTTPLIRIDMNDWPARHLKAAALRVIGYKQTSSSLRGFYLTGALEIEGKVDPAALQRKLAAQIFAAETEPSETLFNMLRYRINPQRASGKLLRLGYRLTDTNEDFTLTLRNSVLQVQTERVAEEDARVEMTRKQFNQLLDGTLSHDKAVAGGARISGNPAVIGELFAVMDRPEELPTPNTSLR